MLLSAFSATIGSNYNKPELVEFQAAERFGCKSPCYSLYFQRLDVSSHWIADITY